MQYADIENRYNMQYRKKIKKVHFSMSTSWLEKIYL